MRPAWSPVELPARWVQVGRFAAAPVILLLGLATLQVAMPPMLALSSAMGAEVPPLAAGMGRWADAVAADPVQWYLGAVLAGIPLGAASALLPWYLRWIATVLVAAPVGAVAVTFIATYAVTIGQGP